MNMRYHSLFCDTAYKEAPAVYLHCQPEEYYRRNISYSEYVCACLPNELLNAT